MLGEARTAVARAQYRRSYGEGSIQEILLRGPNTGDPLVGSHYKSGEVAVGRSGETDGRTWRSNEVAVGRKGNWRLDEVAVGRKGPLPAHSWPTARNSSTSIFPC